MPKPTPDPLKALRAATSTIADCRAARIAWTRTTAAALRKAQRAMDTRLDDAVARLSEREFDRIVEEEQAKVDAFLKPMLAVADHDKWPRALHAKGL